MLGKFEELTLLSVIGAGAPATAVNVFNFMSDGREVSSFGSFFTTLDRLEGKKLVEVQEKEIQTGTGKKRRKVYTVTKAGQKRLRESLEITSRMVERARFARALDNVKE